MSRVQECKVTIIHHAGDQVASTPPKVSSSLGLSEAISSRLGAPAPNNIHHAGARGIRTDEGTTEAADECLPQASAFPTASPAPEHQHGGAPCLPAPVPKVSPEPSSSRAPPSYPVRYRLEMRYREFVHMLWLLEAWFWAHTARARGRVKTTAGWVSKKEYLELEKKGIGGGQ